MPSRRLLSALLLLGPVLPASAAAQTARSYDHVHFSVPDPEAAQAWYMEHLDGVIGESPDRVAFGGMPYRGTGPLPVQLLWARSPEGASAVSGSPIVAVGLSFTNLDEKVRELESAGVRVLAPVREGPGPWRSAVVEDPWGVRIELVEDASLPGFHHVTLRTADPASTADWYVGRFGGRRTRVDGLGEAVAYGSMYVLLEEGPDEAFAAGYGVNHVGWAANRMDDLAARLRDLGVRFTTEPRPALNRYGHRIAFVEGPSGVRIEVVEHVECVFRAPGP